ncbi:DUF362 domain-containing protein [Candidatus Bathyarchaeota archaeon]|nr:DUF362 domain-containing protein [Candidatus Bathyarchaeota archaeon]
MDQLGTVTLDRVKTASELRRSLKDRLPVTETVIVKPNWFSPHPANYTDAEALGMLMEAVDAEFIVAEGYSLSRQDGSLSFTVEGEKVDWGWLMSHPDWSWVRQGGRWDRIRAQDRWFRDTHGFTDLFEEHGAEYVNVTEEIWSGRVVDSREVRKRVEDSYSPAFTDRLYGFMPRRLAAHMGSTLVSLARVKGYGGTYPSLSLKNMFGFVPDPHRPWWHGPGNERLDASIVDIAKLYATYFSLYGLNEAFKNLVAPDPEGEVNVSWGRYSVKPGNGLVAHGQSLVELDAVTCSLMEVDPGKVGYLEKGGEAFGAYNTDHVKQARALKPKYLQL